MKKVLNQIIDYLLIKRSRLFDQERYLIENKDVKASGVDPLLHFVRSGWREGRSPNATFSTSFYLNQYPDVAESGMNPLVHYIRFGKKEGRATDGIAEIKPISKFIVPQTRELEKTLDFHAIYKELTPLPTTPVTDIIICVGRHTTNFKACLDSILLNTSPNEIKIHLVVHEDESEKLTHLASREVEIHTHRMEIFFYAKANNLVLLQSKNDAILLNDDTVVSEGWLEMLRAASQGIALTGAHTGSHCSGNPDMWGRGGVAVTDNPINMFCAFIPYRLRQLIGVLDEDFIYYGGEDVDYSIRARKAGVPLVISEAYVEHKDNQSYGDSKAKLILESERLLIEKHGLGSPYNLKTIQPLTSVIITTYNRPHLLSDALDSVYMSEYPLFEVIVVDDCSDPDTIERLLQLQRELPNLAVIRPANNMGLAGARSLALSMARGDFVYFTDDDDTVLPNRISGPLYYLVRHPRLDAVYCDYNSVNNLGEVTPQYSRKFNFAEYLDQQFTIGSGILFGRTNLFKKVPFDGTYNQALDFDWVFRVMHQGYKLDHYPEIVMNYNRTGFGDQHLSGNLTSVQIHSRIKDREKLLLSLRRTSQK